MRAAVVRRAVVPVGLAEVRLAVVGADSREFPLILRGLIFRGSRGEGRLRREGRVLRDLVGVLRMYFLGCSAGAGGRLAGLSLGRIWNIKWRLIFGLRFAEA
jgi:hypothetical protein